MPKPPYRIPYGAADFIKLRRYNEYYQDKTAYLPLLEEAGRFLFLIRPRRFGKSLLQSVMECYYDVNRIEKFDELFGGTWIHTNPTAEKHQYMVLRFDFSCVHGKNLEQMEASFDNYCRRQLDKFVSDYRNYLPAETEQRLLQQPTVHAAVGKLLEEIDKYDPPPLYLFIDEYDNFANTLLSTEGREAYQQLTHAHGFLRDFFAELKGATGATGSALSRLFITGVSPVTLDDVTSGFNIGRNISLEPRLNGLLGFNEAELSELFAAFNQNYADHRDLMQKWYNHYRFHPEATESITNSDMALHYLQGLNWNGVPPDDLIDTNVRIDYNKLRHLIQLERKLNGSFKRLNQIIANEGIASEIKTSFPAERLGESDNFISLLYFFGLLTFTTEQFEGKPLLTIPNQTVRALSYGYIRDALEDVGLFRPDIFTIGEKLSAFAWRGEWKPFFEHLSEQIGLHAGMRDYLDGEKVVQGFLLAWLNLNSWFYVLSEKELGGGFVDLYLSPFRAKYPDLNHAWMIELKYLSRSSDTPKERQALIADAKTQLQRYRHDQRIIERAEGAEIHSLIFLYVGWELVHCEEWLG